MRNQVLEVVSEGGVEALTVFEGKTVLAADNALYYVSANGPEAFEPALPVPDGGCFEWIAASEGRLYVFLDARILYLEDRQWKALEIPGL